MATVAVAAAAVPGESWQGRRGGRRAVATVGASEAPVAAVGAAEAPVAAVVMAADEPEAEGRRRWRLWP